MLDNERYKECKKCRYLSTFAKCQRISGVIRAYHARVLCVSRSRYVRITPVIRWENAQSRSGSMVYKNNGKSLEKVCKKFKTY